LVVKGRLFIRSIQYHSSSREREACISFPWEEKKRRRRLVVHRFFERDFPRKIDACIFFEENASVPLG